MFTASAEVRLRARRADRHPAAARDRADSTGPRCAPTARAGFGLPRGRAGAAGHRRIAGRAVDQPGHRRVPADASRGRHPGAARRRAGQRDRTRRPQPATPTRRPTSRCRSSSTMERAYAAADFVVCRSGAMTCAELAAVGLPAAYVPLPLRGGEQRHNAEPIVRAGGGTAGRPTSGSPRSGCARTCCPACSTRSAWHGMAAAAARAGARDAAAVLARRVLDIARAPPRCRIEPMSPPPTSDHAGDRPDDWSAPGAALVRSAATDVGAAAGRPRPGPHHGHRRIGHERAGPHPDRARHHRQRLRGARVGFGRGLARDRRRRAHRPLGRPRRERRLLRLHDRDQPPAPRVRRRAGLGQAVPAPRRCARGRTRGQPHRRDRRHPRQDLDDVAARRSPRRPAASTRRSRSAPRSTRAGSTPTSAAATWRSSRPTRATARSC